MGREDETEKDMNQMDFWEVCNAEPDHSIAHGERQPEDTEFWDDNSGKQLGPKLVRRAREEERNRERGRTSRKQRSKERRGQERQGGAK